MKASKILLSIILVISALFTINFSSASASASFKDISSSYRAYKEISYLAQGNIVLGDANGYFNPSRKVTRAEAAAMIGRAIGLNGTKRSTVFKDVGSSNFASGYIMSAHEKGIISGYSDKSFRPNANITRAEMALLISRAFGYSKDDSTDSAILALKSRGISQGYANGDFGADDNIIRADFAVFLARAINYSLRIEPILPSTDETLYVDTTVLNVRTGPSVDYPSIGQVKKGEQVQVAYRVGSWIMIKSGSLTGFVSGGYLTGEVDSDNNQLSDLTIVVDPGHGGKDPGATGFGVHEKDVVLKASLYLKQYLEQTPIKVVMTRTTDVYPTITERVALSKSVNGSAFVSVHANAANGSASGSETLYQAAAGNPYGDENKLLATYIQKRVAAAMENRDRGTKTRDDLGVLKNDAMPSVLVELGFIDNKEDHAKLISSTYQQKGAKAIFYGILDYYGAKGYDVKSYY